MNKLKIAVIGTGLVGSFHAETFFRNPNSELIAVCDIDKEKVNKIANRFKCKAYNEFESLKITKKFSDDINLIEWEYESLDEAKRISGILKERIIEVLNESK